MEMMMASLMLAFLATVSAVVSPLAVQHAQTIHSSSASILSQLQADPSAEELSAMQAQVRQQMAQLQQLSGLLQQQQPTEEQPTAVSMLQTSKEEKKTEGKSVMATELWIHATRAYADSVIVWALGMWLSTAPAELYLARQSDTIDKFRRTYKKTTVMNEQAGLMMFFTGHIQGELLELQHIRREASREAHPQHTTNLVSRRRNKDEGATGEADLEEYEPQEHKQKKLTSFLQLTSEPAEGAEEGHSEGAEKAMQPFAKMDMAIRPMNWASQYFEHVAVNLEFLWMSAKLYISIARLQAAKKTKDAHVIEHATDEAAEDWIEFQQVWGMSTTLHAMCEFHSHHDYTTMEHAGIKTHKDQVAYGYAPYSGSPLYWYPIRGSFKPMETIFKKLAGGKKP